MLSDPCEDLGCIHLSLGSPTHIMPTHALLHLTCSLPARKSIAGEATPVMKTCLREVWTTSGSQRFRMSYFCYIISPYFAMPLGPWGPPDLHIDLGQFITNPEPDCFGHVGDILEKKTLTFHHQLGMTNRRERSLIDFQLAIWSVENIFTFQVRSCPPHSGRHQHVKVGTPPVGRKDYHILIDFSTAVIPFKAESDSLLLACVSFEPSNYGKRISFAHALLKSAGQKNTCWFFPKHAWFTCISLLHLDAILPWKYTSPKR